ncbi:hypothetical protein BLNAU_25267 [Blattamonas nauphoetae]|uniref:Uncharacterized protein n=1 Tax=Blattamonas nauphoetae TaxID=2049346 RepID=A0ABQ9WMT8_9EUKA|nr:hypothetical protein BLNAU_25267 [Blattamonas nauphoetae]
MFTHQLIAIAEEEHAITNFYSGLENADEEDPEKVSSEKAQNGNSLRKDAECDPNQPCRIRSSAKRIPETWTEDRVDREERKVEMRKLHAREWTGIQEAVEEAGRNTNRKEKAEEKERLRKEEEERVKGRKTREAGEGQVDSDTSSHPV